jgi:colanic acid biosynthesis protein WcaH
MTNIADAIKRLKQEVPNPTKGLPDDLFYYISSATPIINVDLLLKDENGRTLLSWRDEPHSGKGWHIPGGIIRFKETIEERINEVAKIEIGTPVKLFKSEPIAINEIFNRKQEIRSHFISLLYSCSLPGDFVPKNKGLSKFDAGYLMWHKTCPDDLLKLHEIYRKFL